MDNHAAAYCADQVRRFDRDRYLCAALAGPEARRWLMALLAFNVEIARVRETAREPVIGQMRLQWWRDAIAEFAGGKVREHPVAAELARAFAARPARLDLVERMLVAREFDLGDEPPDDLAALEAYATDTSANVTLLALDLLGAAGAEADAAARQVGLAWALVGLVRAVPFHARQRRTYLPRATLEAAGISLDDLHEGRKRPALRAVVEPIVCRAEELLAAARVRVPRQAFPALAPAVLARRRLRELARAGYDPFAAKLQKPAPLDPLALVIAALFRRY